MASAEGGNGASEAAGGERDLPDSLLSASRPLLWEDGGVGGSVGS